LPGGRVAGEIRKIRAVKPTIELLITDLDNTLYDWFDFWYHSFTAMLDQIVAISGITPEQLEPEIKKIYERHGTSEYSFLIEELEPLLRRHRREEIRQIYEPAIRAYREARSEHLRLYPHVVETLKEIKSQGSKIIAYTESLEFYSTYRIRKLGLDGILDIVYFPRDHDLPESMTEEQIRYYSSEPYKLQSTQTRHTEKGESKPNPELLAHIIQSVGGNKRLTAYVGDKLPKDVKMAQDAGVIDIYAKYGDTVQDTRYELLRRVTHWKAASVENEKTMTVAEVQPQYTLVHSFRELVDLFEFRPFVAHQAAG
jgi:phosphoglycolate phosphatase-like HAD superfamily hydrolase